MLLVRQCPSCSLPLDRSNWDRQIRRVCGNCVERFEPAGAVSVTGADLALATWRYDDTVGPVIRAAKSIGGGPLCQRLAPQLAATVRPYLQASTVITWIPPSPKGRRRRGFDQGRLLAQTCGDLLGVSVAPAFARSGRAQFGGSRSIRLEGPRLRVRPDWKQTTDQVLVIDDVITTGTSMAAGARLLREATPHTVDIVAAALAVRL